MSEFWWGVLALPIVLVSVAAAAAAVFGAWLLIEKWRKHRYASLSQTATWPVKSRMNDDPTQRPLMWVGKPADLGDRGLAAVHVLLWPKVSFFIPLRGTGIIFMRGGYKVEPQLQKNMARAIRSAMEDINDKEEIEVA